MSNIETNTTNVVSTTKNNYIMFCLPCEGAPYIVKEGTKKQVYKEVPKCVGGIPEGVPRGYFVIHPMFYSVIRWDIMRQLLTTKDLEVYCNDNGDNVCGPNMGTLIPGHRAPMFGDICVIVKESIFNILGYDKEIFELVKCGEDIIWEFEDEKEEEEKKKEFKELGYDLHYLDFCGFVYKKKYKKIIRVKINKENV